MSKQPGWGQSAVQDSGHKEYGLDEIFMKGLLCLLPYYIMRYEDSLHDINEDDEKLGNLLAEYQEIYSRLWTLERERQISL